jgi:hypothetical protein
MNSEHIKQLYLHKIAREAIATTGMCLVGILVLYLVSVLTNTPFITWGGLLLFFVAVLTAVAVLITNNRLNKA